MILLFASPWTSKCRMFIDPWTPQKHTSTTYSDECHHFLGNNFQIMFLCPPPTTCASKTPGVWESLDRRKSSFASSRPEVSSWQKLCPKRSRWVKLWPFEIFVFFCRGTLSPTWFSGKSFTKWKDTHIGGTHFPLNHDYRRKGKSF